MHSYPVQLKLRLDWSEMDLFGHINNVSYFKYIQASRVNYWETIGLTKELHGNMGVGPLLASTGCNFKQPLFYPGDILVRASISYIKNTSFGIHHQVLNDKGQLAAEADDVIVLYNFQSNEKVQVPDELRRKIEAQEGRQF